MTQENVIQLLPTAPEPLGAEETAFVSNALYALAGHIEPLAGLRDEEWALLAHIAETDQGLLNRIELKMRAKMHEIDVKDAGKFSLQKFRVEAKENARRRREMHKLRQKRAKENLKKTQAGREDTEINALEGDTSVEAVDSISQSIVLQAHSWLFRNYGGKNNKGRIWYDEFSGKVMSDWDGSHSDHVLSKPIVIEDDWVRDVWFTLMREDGALAKLGCPQALEAILKVAYNDRRNAPRDWLRGLVWDGQPRLGTWVSRVYGTPQDAYHEAVGRCWFVSMAARANEPGCKADYAPVLYGPEGTYKSTSVAIIGGPWGGEINVGADKQDFLMVIRGKIVVELPELDSLMNRHTTSERVKTIITTRVDEYRAPYARLPIAVPRTAIMVGTTNNYSWHKDDEGGRRFWPICCTAKCDTDWLIANREQLFAEAQHRYVAGESWHDVPVEDQRAAIAQHYAASDPLAERLAQWLDDARFYTGAPGQKTAAMDTTAIEEWEYWGNAITSNRIMTVLMQLPVERQTKAASDRVSRAMRSLGWTNPQIRLGSGRTSAKPRVWVRTDHGDTEQGQLFDKSQ